MKEILSFIRLNKINQTKESLSVAGFPAFTCRKVLGRGLKQVDFSMVMPLLDDHGLPPNSLGEHVTEITRLIPKRAITLIVDDKDVETVVKTIIDVNTTGNRGDGKIFVLPLWESYRIRDGAVEPEEVIE